MTFSWLSSPLVQRAYFLIFFYNMIFKPVTKKFNDIKAYIEISYYIITFKVIYPFSKIFVLCHMFINFFIPTIAHILFFSFKMII